MGRRHRKDIRERKRQKKLIMFGMIGFVCMLSVGYAAFSTEFLISGKGTIIKNFISIDELKVTSVTTGDGLYVDVYEDGRYVYKGANPNNYITFNGETAGWRIVSIETDGTLKIIKRESIGSMPYDSQGLRDITSDGSGGTYCFQGEFGCNVWAAIDGNYENGTIVGTVLKDAELNIYLNTTYYDNLIDAEYIQPHIWNIGPGTTPDNTDLITQIASEKKYTWTGNVGLIQSSDYILANTNEELCGTAGLHNDNRDICKTTNYLTPNENEVGYLTISPVTDYPGRVHRISPAGRLYADHGAYYPSFNIAPSVYLKANIMLSGKGTIDFPYNIS